MRGFGPWHRHRFGLPFQPLVYGRLLLLLGQEADHKVGNLSPLSELPTSPSHPPSNSNECCPWPSATGERFPCGLPPGRPNTRGRKTHTKFFTQSFGVCQRSLSKHFEQQCLPILFFILQQSLHRMCQCLCKRKCFLQRASREYQISLW